MARTDFTSPRLFVESDFVGGREIAVSRDQANYLVNVLRLREGASVLLFNGFDGEWRARIGPITRKAVVLAVAERLRAQPPAPDLLYCFAPLKHARLDYMVQKAVEMGAGTLQPVLTRHTQVARVNLERMRANAIEAAEQCGVLHLPEIRPDQRFEALLEAWEPERIMIFCDEEAEVADPLAALRTAGSAASLGLIIGPEGGFDATERAALLQLPRTIRISLGPRILRADTAAVAALAVVQAALGDWR